jgi:hypothetical protein
MRQFHNTVSLLYTVFKNPGAMRENTKCDSVHVIGRLAPNPRLGAPKGVSRGGKYNWTIIANERREREHIGDVRAGEKGRPLVQHGPRS